MSDIALEARVAALEKKLTEEALSDMMDARIANAILACSGDIVKFGVSEIACQVGRTIISPFTWVGERIGDLFSKPATEPAVETAQASPAAAEGSPAATQA